MTITTLKVYSSSFRLDKMEWKGWPVCLSVVVPSYRSVGLCAIINLDRFTLWSLIEQKDHPLISRLFAYADSFLAGFHPLIATLLSDAHRLEGVNSLLGRLFLQILKNTNMFLLLWRTNEQMLTWSSRRLLFNGPLSQVRTKMRSSCFWRPAATISASKLRRRTKRPTERWAQTLGTESCRQPAVKLTDARRPCQPLCSSICYCSYLTEWARH